MKYLVCLFVVFVSTEGFSDSWRNFKATHSKLYQSIEEEERHYNIFLSNLRKIEEHNEKYKNGESSYEMGVNQFTDMTEEEFEKTLNQIPATLPNSNVKKAEFDFVGDLPDQVDWTKAGAVTGVKNQQQCGSCWAFSVVGAVESHHYLTTKNLLSLSDQQLVDCIPWFGCKGGQTDQALQYIVNNGLMSQADYPYRAGSGTCRYNSSEVAVRITGYERIHRDDEEDLKKAVALKGPVSVRITVTSSFSMYKSGVYEDSACPKEFWQTNHAVIATGYGTENGKDYWLVKNSWGPNWGENGYIKMARNAPNQCGIASIALVPVS